MTSSDLTTKDILDRLGDFEKRASAERVADAERFVRALGEIRREFRYLMTLLIVGLLALAGVQVRYGGLLLTPAQRVEALVQASEHTAALDRKAALVGKPVGAVRNRDPGDKDAPEDSPAVSTGEPLAPPPEHVTPTGAVAGG